jgi:hypothetical protein
MHRKLSNHAAKRHNNGKVTTPRFTAAELAALTVHDDIVLGLTDDLTADIPDGERGARSSLPHWSAAGKTTGGGAAIAVWQMFAPPPGVDVKLPSWLHKQGISWFRGWIRHAGPVGPDYVMDWIIDIDNDTYETCQDGDTGPWSPPPGCDLQTFVDAVAGASRDLLIGALSEKMRAVERLRPLGEGPPLPEYWTERDSLRRISEALSTAGPESRLQILRELVLESLAN